jgi:hypothetical protein
MSTAAGQGDASAHDLRRTSFAWPFTTPLDVGSALHPVNSSARPAPDLPVRHHAGAARRPGGGFGQNLAMLTAARVLIGIGTSAAFPCAALVVFLMGLPQVRWAAPQPAAARRRAAYVL